MDLNYIAGYQTRIQTKSKSVPRELQMAGLSPFRNKAKPEGDNYQLIIV